MATDIPSIDSNIENADWPKRSWDLGIDTLDELFQYLAGPGGSIESGQRELQDFLLLPVARAMPLKLIREVEAWGVSQRQVEKIGEDVDDETEFWAPVLAAMAAEEVDEIDKHGDPDDPGYLLLHPGGHARFSRRNKPTGLRAIVRYEPSTKPSAPSAGKALAASKSPSPKAVAPKVQAVKRVAAAPKVAAARASAVPKRPVINTANPPADDPIRGGAVKVMHPITDSDRKWLKEKHKTTIFERSPTHPNGYTNIYVTDDRKADRLALAQDTKGRTKYWHSAAWHTKSDKKKSDRLKLISDTKLKKLDAALDRDATKNPVAGAAAVIRVMGIRVGDDTNRTLADKFAYGATNLEARHVTIGPDSITLSFVAKQGKDLVLTTDDPLVRKTLIAHLGNKKGSDKVFFPGRVHTRGQFKGMTKVVDRDDVDSYLKSVVPGLIPKDLRAKLATDMALDRVANMPVPKNQKELKKAKEKIADEIWPILGNTRAVVLKSYVMAFVWDDWHAALGMEKAEN